LKIKKEQQQKKNNKKIIRKDGKQEMRTWLNDFNLTHPFVIAGPCSAETEEQVLKIAHELKDSDVSVLEQEYGSQEHVQEDLKGWGNRLKWLKKRKKKQVC
jgi:chorismate mutase